MKFSSLPVMGERDWFNHTVKSLQEAGLQVTLEEPNQDFVLLNGATFNPEHKENNLHVYRAVFSDGQYQMQIVGGSGYIHHQAGEWAIKLPFMIGMASAISGYLDNSAYHGVVELVSDGYTVHVKSYDHAITDSDDWLSFVIFSPYLK